VPAPDHRRSLIALLRRSEARVTETGELLRDVLHDATAPVDDELRRRARAVLVWLAWFPVIVCGLGYLGYVLWAAP
jgi:hypothetical protein